MELMLIGSLIVIKSKTCWRAKVFFFFFFRIEIHWNEFTIIDYYGFQSLTGTWHWLVNAVVEPQQEHSTQTCSSCDVEIDDENLLSVFFQLITRSIEVVPRPFAPPLKRLCSFLIFYHEASSNTPLLIRRSHMHISCVPLTRSHTRRWVRLIQLAVFAH